MHTLTRAMMRGITPDLILRDHPNLGRLIPALYAEYMKDGRNITLNLMNP